VRTTWVAGAAMNRFGRMAETGREAGARVALEALDRAGVEPSRVGLTIASNAFGIAERQAHVGPLLNSALGIPHVPSFTVESACASSSAALHEAYLHVASGQQEVVLVVGFEKLTYLATLAATSYFAMGADNAFESENGATFPGLYATIAGAHARKHGTSAAELGAVAVKNHANGARNPHAHFQREISIETYLDSPVVASPLRLYDCCPFSDGAAAVVVAAAEALPRPAAEPAVIRASALAGDIADIHDRESMTSLAASKRAGQEAFRQAGVEPSAVQFLEVHDCFTIAELIALEDLGFYPPGSAGRATRDGETALDGRRPVNPSGGLKAKGHPISATGAAQVVEVFEQMNGLAGRRQVPHAELALTHTVGATGSSCAVHLFARR
jgi:acetyl-CoA C-acetyltransferase